MSTGADHLPSTFTTKTALALGLHPRDLYGRRDTGQVIELSRGVFRRADAQPATYPDLLAISYRLPTAIACCLTSASVYDLTDEIPATTQVAIVSGSRPPAIDYPPTTVFRFARRTFELGLASVLAAPGERVRIYDAARTVVDLVRLRHRFGESTAYIALRRYLHGAQTRPAVLIDYATALGVLGPVRTALDIVLAE